MNFLFVLMKIFVKNEELEVEAGNTLGEVFANNGLKQLRLAETEKYAHVTFFFNGGREKPFKFEERILIPSPKVATYDQQPEMSANEVTNNLLEAIRNNVPCLMLWKNFDLEIERG